MKTEMKLTRRFFSILFIICLLTACSKDGATGPQGAQGEQGPAGLQGTDGADGETGTANVVYSPWIQFNWSTPVGEQDNFTVDAPDLTQEIVDTGVLLVYARGLSATKYALPVVLNFPAGSESYTIEFEEAGSFDIGVRSMDGNDIGNPILDNEFRYVIIPGGNPTSGKAASSIVYSKMTYEEIAALFNIKD